MLFNAKTLSRIKAGDVNVAFRRWRRPTVKTGGTLNTRIGQLAIESVREIDESEIGENDALDAGFDSLNELLSLLNRNTTGRLYRIDFRLNGPDPRIVLRREIPETAEELHSLLARLARLDKASKTGPWTFRVLTLILEFPAIRAGDLATRMGMEKPPFKINVRKLKGLGLTESLNIGYRLSPRGNAVLAHLRSVKGELG